MTLSADPVHGLPEVRPGDDLAGLLVTALASEDGPGLQDGDVLVVTSKVISKAEGRVVVGRDRDQVIDSESASIVAQWTGPHGRTVISRTRHGLVLAAAGVDASNTEPGSLVLLPEDPDASARALRQALRHALGVNVGVVVSDTMGRAWRIGQTDAAVGAAGLSVVEDLRGSLDGYGRVLDATVRAVADEVASAADLVAGKALGVPAVVVRGLDHVVLPPDDEGPGAGALVRSEEEDRFRLGASEAIRQGLRARRTVRHFADMPVPRDAVLQAIGAAATAPAPHRTRPWRFVVVETSDARRRLLDAMQRQWVSDLRADGLDDTSIKQRVRRGDVLRHAPLLVVPALVTVDQDPYADERRASAEQLMFVLSMGAATQNLLVSLSAEGVGSAWVGATLFCPGLVRDVLGLPEQWQPTGIIAVGFPASPLAPRPDEDVRSVLLTR